jgi:hypothetical protein
MIPCASGSYSFDGSSFCITCPQGYYCPSRSSSPIICPPGSYSKEGQSNCVLATEGYEVLSFGESFEMKCGVGYYSSGGGAKCSLCDPGYKCRPGSIESAPSVDACPLGGYCNPADTFTPCPLGSYGVATAGTSASQACKACDAGYYCQSDGTTKTICPPGGFCPEGFYFSIIILFYYHSFLYC